MNHHWTHCYRMRPYFRRTGMLCAALSSVMAAAASIAWWLGPGDDQVNMPGVITGFLLFTVLGLYLLLVSCRYRLLVGDAGIEQREVLRTKQIDPSSVDEVKWRRFPNGGSVRLAGRFGVLKIELGNFVDDDRTSLISWLRASIAESKQIGWCQFDQQFADSPEKRRRSTRSNLLWAFVFGAHCLAFSTIWAFGGGVQYLVVGVINGLGAAYLVRAHLRKKH